MGCDYYIIKRLKIEHSDGIDTIELDREQCYFNESIYDNSDIDSDDTYYNEKINEKIKKYLQVTYKPRVLLEDGEWKNERLRDKYIDIVYDKLKNYNNAFSNINLIVKEEIRYLR